MWQLDNRTPYAAAQGWIRDREGAEIWLVAVKATYEILPDGGARLAEEQVPVYSGPQKDPATGQLRYETDLGPQKSGTDIILNGHAYSPSGAPIRELSIAFRVGPLTRTAIVYGDRHWRKGASGYTPSKPAPFTQMSLDYRRAVGGDDPDSLNTTGNPDGCGLLKPKDNATWRMPNLENIHKPLSRPSDRPAVVGFGPVPTHWPGRSRYAGTYDEAWFKQRRPLLPEDLDPRFWRIAPPEQQLSHHLKGGEPISFVNLTQPGFCPESRLFTEIPRLTLGFETRFYDNSKEHSRAKIHTLILEPDYPRISVVYHMALPCHPKVNLLDRTIIREKQRPLDRPVEAQPEAVEA
ncbi:MAG: DUF2169 domain-containing protein [Candidatus Thiodiazotropha sp.]